MATAGLGSLGISEDLRRFVDELPLERESILRFLSDRVGRLAPGARVADVGAGDAPYRELFSHVDYLTIDWEQSPHEGAREVDIVASAESVPEPDGSFDAVVLTQLLEHVPAPALVVAEMHRLLRPGGTLLATVPFVWELHEMPHDFFRYTSEGLRHLLETAGFVDVEVESRNDCFSTLAQLMRNVRWSMGRAPDGLNNRRGEAADTLDRLADEVALLAPLDVKRIFPLGYAASATRR